MKIGIDVRELRRGSSTGIGRTVSGLLRYAAGHKEHSLVLYGDARTRLEDFPWAEGRRLAARWPIADHWELPRLLRRDRVDLFFSPYYKAPWRCPCPYVVTIHDLIFMHVDNGVRAPWLSAPLMRLCAARFAAEAAGVLTVSEFSKSEIERILGVPAAKIEVVANPVPEGFAPADPERQQRTLQRHRLAPGFLLFVGSFKESKNPQALIEAFSTLDPSLRRAHPLLLVGPADQHYRRLLRRSGDLLARCEARFLFSPHDEDLVSLYSACGLCVVPSLVEGFGMPALEAMACGAPVLASDRTSLPEVVGEAGALSPPDAPSLGEAIARLLKDGPRLAAMRERGLARARQYASSSTGQRIFAFLERCRSADPYIPALEAKSSS